MKPGLDGTVTPNARATIANVGSTNEAPGTNASMIAQKPATYAAQVTSDQPTALMAAPGWRIVSRLAINSCQRPSSGSDSLVGSQRRQNVTSRKPASCQTDSNTAPMQKAMVNTPSASAADWT